MKQYIFKTMLIAACTLGFTACSDDDDEPVVPEEVNTSFGVFVVNSGNMSKKIDGSLDYIDLASNTVTNEAFKKANGRSLGMTPNDVFAYGSKLYIAVDGEQTVEVMDVKTLKSIKQIKVEGGARHLAAYDGKMYVSSFNGEVNRIDTTALNIDKTVKVGSYPECMTILNGTMMVANSGYGSGTTVSLINMSTFTMVGDVNCPTNPVNLTHDGKNIYLLCSGKYKADWSGYEENPAVYKYSADGKFTKLFEATAFGNNAENIYSFNANYYEPEITYTKYNMSTGSQSNMSLQNDIKYPCAIAVDPITNHLWVSSYNLSEYGYANYSAPGYIVEFDENGTKLHEYNTGVSPIAIRFYNNLK